MANGPRIQTARLGLSTPVQNNTSNEMVELPRYGAMSPTTSPIFSQPGSYYSSSLQSNRSTDFVTPKLTKGCNEDPEFLPSECKYPMVTERGYLDASNNNHAAALHFLSFLPKTPSFGSLKKAVKSSNKRSRIGVMDDDEV